MEYEGDERYATQRARYLARSTNLRKIEGEAVAFAERGYSANGIAKKMDTSASTAQGYLKRAWAEYGMEVGLEKVLPGEQPPDYERVDPGYHRDLPPEERERWVGLVVDHADKLPADWVADVLDEAKADGLRARTG